MHFFMKESDGMVNEGLVHSVKAVQQCWTSHNSDSTFILHKRTATLFGHCSCELKQQGVNILTGTLS